MSHTLCISIVNLFEWEVEIRVHIIFQGNRRSMTYNVLNVYCTVMYHYAFEREAEIRVHFFFMDYSTNNINNYLSQ